MGFTYHRENLKIRLAYMAGLLGAAALATLPIVAHAADDGAAITSPAVSDNISEAAPPAWQQIGDDSETAASDGPILELPQVVTSSHPQSRATATSADDASTDDAFAQDASVVDDGSTNGDSVNDEDATPPPPVQQLGDVDDYKDQETVASALPLWPAPAAVVAMPRAYLGPNYGAMPRPGVIVVRPFGLSPIPASSPMLSAPFRSGSVLGGWWQRAR